MNVKACGVYVIVNIDDGKFYIGSAQTSFQKRFAEHKRMLRKNRHHNGELQDAWNRFGEGAFDFSIVEECKPDKCYEREQYWLDYYDASNLGYNIRPIACGPPDSEEWRIALKKGCLRRNQSKEYLENVGKGCRERSENPQYRAKLSKSTKLARMVSGEYRTKLALNAWKQHKQRRFGY